MGKIIHFIGPLIDSSLYLNIIIVSREALRLLWCDVDVRAYQGSKEAFQLLLDPPELILTIYMENHMKAATKKCEPSQRTD